MKKETIKPLPVVKAYTDYFARRAKRVLKLKDSDYEHINIDFYGRTGVVCAWVHGKEGVIGRAEFESDGRLKATYDSRPEAD